MTLIQKSNGIYVDDSFNLVLSNIDSIIFDCDGVLIDITKSYDETIIKTVQYVLENFAKIDDMIKVNFEIIDKLNKSGYTNIVKHSEKFVQIDDGSYKIEYTLVVENNLKIFLWHAPFQTRTPCPKW